MLEIEKEQLKTSINNSFQAVKQVIYENLDNQSDKNYLDEIACEIVYGDGFDYGSRAFYSNIENILRVVKLQFNIYKMPETIDVMFHEFAHLICYQYLKDGKHNFHFAIVNYCLLHKFTGKQKHFFKAYDVSEDDNYHLLSINNKAFDEMIISINWKNFDELTTQAKEKYAMMCSSIN